MIRYALKCRNKHGFESWFKSAEAYETLRNSGMIACPECQDTYIEKSLMAPPVRTAREKTQVPAPRQPVTNDPSPELSEAIRTIREHVEQHSDYVGDRFANEARAMHAGEVPTRSIYGEVRAEEARKLVEDGVPAVPLPFIPRQKIN
jgi:hypothetical protein